MLKTACHNVTVLQLWSNNTTTITSAVISTRRQTHRHSLGCHLLRLSSALQLTDSNPRVLISCVSESFALLLGEDVFSGLCSQALRSEDKASQRDNPRGVVPTCFYFSTEAGWAGWPRRFQLHLKCSRWKISGTFVYSLLCSSQLINIFKLHIHNILSSLQK